MVKEQSKEEKSIPHPKLLVPVRKSSNPLLNRPINPKLQMEVPNGLGFDKETVHKSSHPLLSGPSDPDLDITIGRRERKKEGDAMNPILRTILTIVGTTSPVATIYYFWPGFEHLGTSGTGSQPTAAAISTIVFLVTFFTAVQLTPRQETSRQSSKSGENHE